MYVGILKNNNFWFWLQQTEAVQNQLVNVKLIFPVTQSDE